MGKVIAIDFGTTSVRAAYCQDGEVHVIPDEVLDVKLPLIIDQPDKERFFVHSKDVSGQPIWRFAGLKQGMNYLAEFSNDSKKIKVLDCVTQVLHEIKGKAGAYLHEPITGAVITVPTCFVDQERITVRTAAENAGFSAIKLLDESLAAVLAGDFKERKTVLVYDLGASTFSASIFDIENGQPKMLRNNGSHQLGVYCFDEIIAGSIHQYLSDTIGEQIFEPVSDYIQWLKGASEDIKIKLDQGSEAGLNFDSQPFFSNDQIDKLSKATAFSVNRNDFEGKALHIVEATVRLMDKIIKEAKMERGQIDVIMLSGNGSKVPLVRREIEKAFSCEIVEASDNFVLKGAAMFTPKLSVEKNAVKSVQESNVYMFNPVEQEEQEEEKDEAVQEDISEHKADGIVGDLTDRLAHSIGMWDQGHHEQAISEFESCHNEFSKLIYNYYMTRARQIENVDIDQSLALYERAAKLSDDSQLRQWTSRAYAKKAITCWNNNQKRDAKMFVRKGRDINPDCPDCRKIRQYIKSH